MSNGETNSVIINKDELLKVRFAWIARIPNERMKNEAQEALVSCFESSDILGVGVQSKYGKLESLNDLRSFIMPEHIAAIRKEWSNQPGNINTRRSHKEKHEQYGCVIIFPRRHLTEEVEDAIDALQLKLKTITQNERFKGAVIIY